MKTIVTRGTLILYVPSHRRWDTKASYCRFQFLKTYYWKNPIKSQIAKEAHDNQHGKIRE